MRPPAPMPDTCAAAAPRPARRPALWTAAALILLAAIIAILAGANPGHAQDACTALALDQHDDTTPGGTFNLTLAFDPPGCTPPGDFASEITITLHQDIGIPSGFNKENIRLRAPQRYNLQFADLSRSDNDEPHGIELPGCAGWQAIGSNEYRGCDTAQAPLSIQLRDLRLPDAPASDGDEYTVTIRWGDGADLPQKTIRVDAALEISGDRELDYNDTARFQGYGFSSGLTVRLYAKAGNDAETCDNRTGEWKDIGNTNVGTDRKSVV